MSGFQNRKGATIPAHSSIYLDALADSIARLRVIAGKVKPTESNGDEFQHRTIDALANIESELGWLWRELRALKFVEASEEDIARLEHLSSVEQNRVRQ